MDLNLNFDYGKLSSSGWIDETNSEHYKQLLLPILTKYELEAQIVSEVLDLMMEQTPPIDPEWKGFALEDIMLAQALRKRLASKDQMHNPIKRSEPSEFDEIGLMAHYFKLWPILGDALTKRNTRKALQLFALFPEYFDVPTNMKYSPWAVAPMYRLMDLQFITDKTADKSELYITGYYPQVGKRAARSVNVQQSQPSYMPLRDNIFIREPLIWDLTEDTFQTLTLMRLANEFSRIPPANGNFSIQSLSTSPVNPKYESFLQRKQLLPEDVSLQTVFSLCNHFSPARQKQNVPIWHQSGTYDTTRIPFMKISTYEREVRWARENPINPFD